MSTRTKQKPSLLEIRPCPAWSARSKCWYFALGTVLLPTQSARPRCPIPPTLSSRQTGGVATDIKWPSVAFHRHRCCAAPVQVRSTSGGGIGWFKVPASRHSDVLAAGETVPPDTPLTFSTRHTMRGLDALHFAMLATRPGSCGTGGGGGGGGTGGRCVALLRKSRSSGIHLCQPPACSPWLVAGVGRSGVVCINIRARSSTFNPRVHTPLTMKQCRSS